MNIQCLPWSFVVPSPACGRRNKRTNPNNDERGRNKRNKREDTVESTLADFEQITLEESMKEEWLPAFVLVFLTGEAKSRALTEASQLIADRYQGVKEIDRPTILEQLVKSNGHSCIVRAMKKDASCVGAVVEAMQKFPKDELVQVFGARTIQLVCSKSNDARDQVRDDDGIRVLLTTWDNFAGHKLVAFEVCAALVRVLGGNAANKQQVLKAGGLDIALASMHQLRDSASIQKVICMFLHTMTKLGFPAVQAMKSLRAQALIAAAMENYPNHTGTFREADKAMKALMKNDYYAYL